MRTLRTNRGAAALTCLSVLVTAPALSACHPVKPTAPAVGIPAHTKSVTPYEIPATCQNVNAPKKRFQLVIDNLNINHLNRDIKDEQGNNAKYPIPNSPYNTLYDIDLRDHLKADKDAVVVRVILKDKKIKFAAQPDQITSGDADSLPMFCGLTNTLNEITMDGKSFSYVEFTVKYARGAGDSYHTGNFNINLIAVDSTDTSYSLPFSLDPHVGNNG